MIRTEQLTKTYQNGYKAVKGLSLQVDEGDIFGFLGPNGAGKTTTIRMLDGLLVPTSGKAFVGGMDIQTQSLEIKKIIGVVPESHGYYYWMTAKEYLQYFNSLFNGRKSNDLYVDELLKKVGLDDKKNVPIGQFSRGMKQRLGIAKSLINKPKIIFLDEPTLGLDPRGQKEIQQLILDINREDNITVFITSHLLKDIEVLCNKVCIIKDGALVEQGSIEGLQSKYMTGYSMMLQTSDNELVQLLLKNIPSVASVTVCGDQLEVKLEDNLLDDQINWVKHQMLSTIFSSNVDMKELYRKTLSMEDIFFKATEVKSK